MDIFATTANSNALGVIIGCALVVLLFWIYCGLRDIVRYLTKEEPSADAMLVIVILFLRLLYV